VSMRTGRYVVVLLVHSEVTLTPGSNVLVAGTSVFGSKDPKATIAELRSAVDDAIAEKSKQ